MQDPFADKSNNKLQREVQFWMAGLTCLLIAFLYLSIKRMTGFGDEIPAHVLQSGVAHVVPPLEHDPNGPQSTKTPQLTNAPAIPTGRFSPTAKTLPPRASQLVNKPLAQPKFGTPKHRQPSETFAKAAPKTKTSVELPQSSHNNQLVFPQPSFALPVAPKTVKPEVDEKAESIGRRRARQLAAITSGLPKRLSKIQSSIKQASAELPVEKPLDVQNLVAKNNSFISAKSIKTAKALPPHPETKSSLESFPARPLKSNPIVVTPTVESSKPLNSIRKLNTKTSPAEIQPAKITTSPNSFQPLTAATASTPAKPLPIVKPSTASVQQQDRSQAKTPTTATQNRENARPRLKDLSSKVNNRNQPVSTSKQYIVDAGDSFFTIAQQQYGDGQWFRALRLANQKLINERGGLHSGMSLSIPTTQELTRQFPDQAVQTAAQQPTEAERRIYVTQAGDTLFDIARRKTGQGSRFSEIIKHNQFSLPAQIRASDQLPADLRLVLPESTLQ